MTSFRIIEGDCIEGMLELDEQSVQTCVTSPPYWGLRDYGHDDQLGLESTPEEYVANLVAVFREVRRVLRDDGTVWLNLGDSYCAAPRGSDNGWDKSRLTNPGTQQMAQRQSLHNGHRKFPTSVKPKDLVGIPWLTAFALRADGWYLRSEVIWHKRNPMPESVQDRPTRSHEQLFLLSKGPRYFYDAGAIREADLGTDHTRTVRPEPSGGIAPPNTGIRRAEGRNGTGRNKRSVWTVNTAPFPGAHFATFPPKLIEPCILAGSGEGDTVLDPFAGAGTTGLVALRHNRDFIGCELNPEYAQMARDRITDDAPLLNVEAA